MQRIHGSIPHMFDCWADQVVHLQLKMIKVQKEAGIGPFFLKK